MSHKKAQEFRDQSIEELQAGLMDCKKAIFELKNEQRQTKQTKNPTKLRLFKKEIARMLTVITEKEHAATKEQLS